MKLNSMRFMDKAPTKQLFFTSYGQDKSDDITNIKNNGFLIECALAFGMSILDFFLHLLWVAVMFPLILIGGLINIWQEESFYSGLFYSLIVLPIAAIYFTIAFAIAIPTRLLSTLFSPIIECCKNNTSSEHEESDDHVYNPDGFQTNYDNN